MTGWLRLNAIMSNQVTTTDLLTTEEAAKFLRCHTVTILRQIKANRIPATRFGRSYVIHKDVLRSLIPTRPVIR